jgi:hypothetical protein
MSELEIYTVTQPELDLAAKRVLNSIKQFFFLSFKETRYYFQIEENNNNSNSGEYNTGND